MIEMEINQEPIAHTWVLSENICNFYFLLNRFGNVFICTGTIGTKIRSVDHFRKRKQPKK